MPRRIGESGAMVGVATAVFAVWCVVLGYYDVTQLRLPNALTVGGAAAVVLYGLWVGAWQVAVTGGALLAAVYLVVHLIQPAALGAGDVKLALGLGGVSALAGPQAWVLAALLAPVGTAVAGVVLILMGRRHAAIPHGPFMCGATLLALAAQFGTVSSGSISG